MAATAAVTSSSSPINRQLVSRVKATSSASSPNSVRSFSSSFPVLGSVHGSRRSSLQRLKVKATPETNNSVSPADDGDGISLGTMKLPLDVDVPRFETLLFQWGNSLCQGANLPLPVPLKIDKIQGGIRLGFVEIDDGKTNVPVYIDCLIFPGTEFSGPYFRAVRNGVLKNRAPAGEPRIMKSLLAALQKSVEIARV